MAMTVDIKITATQGLYEAKAYWSPGETEHQVEVAVATTFDAAWHALLWKLKQEHPEAHEEVVRCGGVVCE